MPSSASPSHDSRGLALLPSWVQGACLKHRDASHPPAASSALLHGQFCSTSGSLAALPQAHNPRVVSRWTRAMSRAQPRGRRQGGSPPGPTTGGQPPALSSSPPSPKQQQLQQHRQVLEDLPNEPWRWRLAAQPAGELLLSLLLLALSQHAGARLLSPQTGDWLAGWGQLLNRAVAAGSAAAAAAAGRTGAIGAPATEGRAAAAAPADAAGKHSRGRPSLRPRGLGRPWAWWLAAAVALGAKLAVQGVGAMVLAPGLAATAAGGRAGSSTSGGSARVWAAGEVTARCLLLSAASLGPLFASLGCIVGSSTAELLSPLAAGAGHPAPRVLLLPLPLSLVGGAAALLCAASGLPPTLLPHKPACALCAVVAVAAAAAAILAGRSGRQARKGHTRGGGGSSSGRNWAAPRRQASSAALPPPAATAVACAAAIAGAAVLLATCYPCTAGLGGGSAATPLGTRGSSMLWRCEAAAGGAVAVVEGSLQGAYR